MNEIATTLGVSPAFLQTFALIAIYLAAKATSRLIPDSATGWKATVRNIAGIVSVDISSRIAPGVTIAAVAASAAATPPVKQAVEAETGATLPPSTTQGA